MWILPSRLRPKNIERFIKGWEETGSCTKLCLALDKDDPELKEYLKIKLPKLWKLIIVPKRLSLMAIYNYIYRKFPWEPWYGILDDDYMPQTMYWDAQLVAEAGKDKIAYPKNNLIGPENLACWVIAKKLVKKIGWLMPPFTQRLYGDNVWMEIGKKFNCLKYCDDIQIRHYHFSDGSAPFDETYNKPTAGQDRIDYFKWLRKFNPQPPITFVCVDVGNYQGMGAKYVTILYDSVMRNLADTVEGRFVCLTDDLHRGYPIRIELKKVEYHGDRKLNGWWNKLLLFRQELFKQGERLIYLHLDTCIVSGLDEIIKYKGKFAILRDFYRYNGLGSGVMMWTPTAKTAAIWWKYEMAGYPELEGGDQAWIEKMVQDGYIDQPDLLQDLYPKQFVSYKVDAKFNVPKSAKVCCFHGLPRPHEVTDGWVPSIWKVGGGSVMEFDYVPNVPTKLLQENLRYSMTLPYPQLGPPQEVNEQHVVIVGGGPSLADCLDGIRERAKRGQVIWALNNSFKYLKENGIFPHAHVILDAREKNAEFVPEATRARLLYSSTCHPKVFANAEKSGGEIVIWHTNNEVTANYFKGQNINAIAAGDTVGLQAMGIAYIFGFRFMHLYGYDSSYRGLTNHAYPQALNDGERVIEVTVNGEKFRTAAWMASQTEQFKDLAVLLNKKKVVITVHGDGLLPYVASLLGKPTDALENNICPDCLMPVSTHAAHPIKA